MPQESKKQRFDKPPSRKGTKKGKQSLLWHFESMDRVNQAMQGTNDLEQMMKDVLDTLLSVFECDRAWLVYPCDPDSTTWQVPMERTRPEYPGALPIGTEMPLTPPGAEVFRKLRAANGPVRFGPGLENQVDLDMRQNFRIQSYIAMALYPKIGKPWSFGLHQCSYARVWTTEEERLFQEIGRHLADSLSILLAFRNTQESEKQIKQLIDASPVAMVVSSGAEERVEWVNEKFIELFGYTAEDMPDVEHWWPVAYPDETYRTRIRAQWEDSTKQAIWEKREIQPMEATVRCKDGSLRHIEFRLSSIGEKHLVTFVDLTEHRASDEKLRASEQLFRALVENSPDFIARYDREFRRIYVNPAIQKLFGVPAENVLGKTPSEQSPVYAPQVYIEHLRQVIETATESVTEMPYRTSQGEMHWGHMRFVPEFGPDGKVASVLAIGRDIHEIKENERRFRMLAENFPDLVMRFDRDGRYIYVNPAFKKAFDMTSDSVVGKTLQELPPRIKPERNDGPLERIRRAFDEGNVSDVEVHWETKAGERIFENRYVPEKDAAGSVATVLCIARDVTEQKRAGEELQKTNTLLRAIIEAAPTAIIGLDLDGKVQHVWNPAAEKMLGWNAEEAMGNFLPSVPVEGEQELREWIRSGKSLNGVEVQRQRRDNTPIIYSIYASPLRDSDGNTTGNIAVLVDITERKQMTEALAAREQEFRTLAEYSPDNIARYDVNCRTVYVNPTLERTLGRPASEMLGTLPAEEGFIREAKEYQEKMVEVLKTGKENEMNVVLPDMGEGVRYHNIRFVAERGADGAITGIQAIGRDLTERKRTEEALQESEERLRQITSSLREVVWLRDAQTRQVLYVNPAFQELTGRTCESFYENRDIVADAIYPDDREDVTQALDQRSPSVPFDKEHRIIHLNGSVRWVSSKSFAVRNEAGEVYRWATIMEDITERKLAEAALRESEKKFRGFVESSSEGFTLVDEQGTIIEWNPAREKMTGLPASQVLGQKLWDVQYQMILPKLRTPEFYERFKQTLLNALQTGQSPIFDSVMEAEVIHPSNLSQFIQQTVFPIKTDKGYRIGSVTSDITERKLAERALQESEERYRLLHENAGVGIGYYTPDGQIISYNQLAASHMQGRREDFEGRSIYDVFPREEAEFYMGRIRKSLETESTLEYEDHLELPSGEKWFLSIFTKICDAQQNVTGVQIISQDITEQKQAEESLRESERRLVAAQNMAHVGYWERDFDTNRVALSDEACRIFGISEQGLSLNLDEWHSRWVTLIHPEDQPRLIKLLGDVLAGVRSYDVEYRVVRPDGAIRFIYSQAEVERDKSGHAHNMLGMMQDITERKQAEQALRASENRFRVLSENAFVGIYIIQDGRLSYVNSTLAKIFGYTPEELTGAEPALVIHPDDQAMVSENIRRRIVGEVETVHYEFRGRCKDGEIKNIEVLGGRIDFGGKTAVIGNLMDITERKRHELERESIITVSTTLRQATTKTDILNVILDQLMELFKADGSVLVLPDPQTKGLIDEMGRGPIGERMVGLTIPPETGVCYWVIQNRRPYLTNHVDQDPIFYRPDLLGDSRCLAAVPLIAQEQAIGALWIARQVNITEQDLGLLNAIADIAANAIHRVTLHEQTVQQLRHLLALHQIELAISANFDLSVTLNVILKNVKEELEVDAASILLLDTVTHTLDYAAGNGFRTRRIEQSHVKLGHGYAGRAAQEYRTISGPNLNQAPGTFSRSSLLADEEFLSHYATPLIVKGQVKGVLEIFHRKAFESDQEWIDYFETLATQAAIAIENASLFQNLQRSNMELIMAYDATIEGWSHALDLRDRETEGHTRRVTEMALKLAEKLGMSGMERADVRRGALLHDIGKMGVPDAILLKPGPLSEAEWEWMQKHPNYAFEMLSPIPYLKHALDIPYYHHEKWNGTGYPLGLKGEAIPLSARLFAIVDVFDALTSDRPYRAAWPREKAFRYIQEQSGISFDPQIVKVFLKDME